jgi:ribosomal protein L11 methyltransferase
MPENPTSAATARPRFQCVVAEAPDLERAERALAEAMAAGATGAEQREAGARGSGEGGVTLLLYAADADAGAVRAAAEAVLGAFAVTVEAVVEQDWSEAWKEGLRPVEVSPRLRIRPSFDASPARPGQRDLVIDPGQAFGTGGHESTRLALEGLDALRREVRVTPRVLDVGTGTGVLALAALALGARRAVGLDLDPLAAPAARENASRNGEAAHLDVFTGPVEALAPEVRFHGIVANLLRRELEPLIEALARRVEPGGWLVFSGLLDEEVDELCARFASAGIAREAVLRARDASGVLWAGLLMRRPADARG